MSSKRQAITFEIGTATLARLREIAAREGLGLPALVDEALADLVEKRQRGRARPHVMAGYRKSREKYDELYRKLAESEIVSERRFRHRGTDGKSPPWSTLRSFAALRAAMPVRDRRSAAARA